MLTASSPPPFVAVGLPEISRRPIAPSHIALPHARVAK
jgi:hypothetical protein